MTQRGIIKGTLHVNLDSISNLPPDYEGSYEIDPTKTEQYLATKNKVMRKDVKVLGIFYYEVTNMNGGTTVTIGRD